MSRVLRRLLFAVAFAGLFVLAWTRIPATVWYRDRRPTRAGRATNRFMGRFAASGLPSFGMVSLEVPGWKSGRPTSTVLVLARHEGSEYLVSMLGEGALWVRNVRAAGGRAVLRHGSPRAVRLVEVPVHERAPILRAYLEVAPGGRPHIPVARGAALEEFERVAADFPVFRVEPLA